MVARFRAWKTADLKKFVGVKSAGKKLVKKRKISQYLQDIMDVLGYENIPFTCEYRFHETRKWRFDLVIGGNQDEVLHHKIAIEYNGGLLHGGRHTSIGGYLNDLEKINAAQVCGFRVLQYSAANFLPTNRSFIGTLGVIEHVRALMK